MINLRDRESKHSSRREVYLDDEKARREYCRITAGIVGPGAYPGAYVMVAEHRGKPHYRVLKCVSCDSPTILGEKMKAEKRKSHVSQIFGNLEDEGFRKHLQRTRQYLPILQAPFASDFPYALNLVRDLVRPSRKRLMLGDHRSLEEELRRLPEILKGVRSEEYPLTLALTYAVGGMETYKHNPDQEFEIRALNEQLHYQYES